MKSLLLKRFVVVGILLLLSFSSFGDGVDNVLEKPTPPRLVNDFAGMMNPMQREELEEMLNHYNDSTSTQITIVTIPTLNGNDIADYTVALGEKWGVGNKSKNNGIVILAAAKERKIFIATGYGMEGAVPDATTFLIVRNEITPEFKIGDYYNGFRKGVLAIVAASSGEYTNDNRDTDSDGIGAGSILIVIIIIVLIIFAAIKGGGGRGGGNYMRRSGSDFLTGAILGSLLGGGGRSSGSGFGGGSSGGGGFGGFGGGSFGGGGAGGSW